MMRGHGRILICIAAVAAVSLLASAHAQPPEGLHTFDWAVIGDPGNVAYDGEFDNVPIEPPSIALGRGAVDYNYRVSKLEVSAGQWIDFANRFATQSNDPFSFLRGQSRGIRSSSPFGNYILNPFVENPEQMPVGVDFVAAMMYSNWLHNGTPDDIDSLFHGAYTLDFEPGERPKAEKLPLEHEPDAKFWIPTLDEWLKAAHYDPDHDGPGEGGWWRYNTTSDTAPEAGMPGEGETSAGIDLIYPPDHPEYVHPMEILLGSYPETTSPWGLLDTSGGYSEWTTEQDPLITRPDIRLHAGRASNRTQTQRDSIPQAFQLNGVYGSHGLRLASPIPSPSTIMVVMYGAVVFHRRRKR